MCVCAVVPVQSTGAAPKKLGEGEKRGSPPPSEGTKYLYYAGLGVGAQEAGVCQTAHADCRIPSLTGSMTRVGLRGLRIPNN